MPVVYQAESLAMGWCLDCHRNPEPNLVPPDQVTDLIWVEQEWMNKPVDERVHEGLTADAAVRLSAGAAARALRGVPLLEAKRSGMHRANASAAARREDVDHPRRP